MSHPPHLYATTDGAYSTQPRSRKASSSPPNDDFCCIYVHAGAGYHSHQNEKIHLEACNDAAQLAMLILKNGGTALDAIEAAVKTLEDREITNAGYGSNLAMDGVVECDATIVDHHGRSGAVGAVAQIKNPISLARLVHSHTMQSLTLRRVPPNLLVAQGATEFAVEMGMPIMPHDALVSPAAKERWLRWRADLKAAERKGKKTNIHPSSWKVRTDITPEDEVVQRTMREQHTQNLLRGRTTVDRSPSTSPSPSPSNESRYYSHGEILNTPIEPSLPSNEQSSSSWQGEMRRTTPATSDPSPVPDFGIPHTIKESSRNAFINSTQKVPTVGQYKDHGFVPDATFDAFDEDTYMEEADHSTNYPEAAMRHGSRYDGSENSDSIWTDDTTKQNTQIPSTIIVGGTRSSVKPNDTDILTSSLDITEPSHHLQAMASIPTKSSDKVQHGDDRKEDVITDTVGAIAVDSWGNIACGASSGGIGMKYRGRVGPAALVGVGAAVIPTDPDDPEQACVATVTSGTGEHMATTMAATTCAERLYQSVKKVKGGEYMEVSEDEAIQAMIENEFMGHPSVKYSNSTGAIGILGVKRMCSGTLLYFGHNTDSFAMASMSSDDPVPKCTMSRSKGNGQIAQGGRMLPLRRNKRTKASQRYR